MLRQLNLNIQEQVDSLKAITAARAQLPLSTYDPHINLFIKKILQPSKYILCTKAHAHICWSPRDFIRAGNKGLFFHNL